VRHAAAYSHIVTNAGDHCRFPADMVPNQFNGTNLFQFAIERLVDVPDAPGIWLRPNFKAVGEQKSDSKGRPRADKSGWCPANRFI